MSAFTTQRTEAGCGPHGAREAEPFMPTLLGHMATSPTLADGPMALTALFARARSFAFERRC